ncbi:MAG: Ca2+/H+ antiporter, family [Chloroflexota bacterium]|jgi:putative Ca2+/H+ antiporter (TMEM165/GDT1 family)|nr:Ca2+/H+ antiporter, family [Chloroflexota bacterium]
MSAFIASFLLITLAEMGDKTQLVALAFATRYSAWVTLAGVLVATLIVHLFSVAIGEVLGLALPTQWIQLGAGLAFIAFAAWTIRGDSLDDKMEKPSRFGPFLTVAIAFFIAELGDKTMLTTITLASQYQSFTPVWLGSTLGMTVADGMAIAVGVVAGRRLPQRAIKLVAAAIFFAFGVWAIAAAVISIVGH